MLGLSGWTSFLAVLAAAGAAWLLSRFSRDDAGLVPQFEAALEHRLAPLTFGVLTGAVTWFVWGGLARVPVIPDDIAYLLQAEIFARGAWKMPAPPIPEFFEQAHVLVTPVIASKYHPGHSLMLAPAALIGLPGLAVVALNGITGAFIFLLARVAANGRVALLAWLIWVACFPAIYFRATYLSGVTSSAAWLVAWWCLWQWRRARERRWMLGLAAAVGVVAITRPLTGVALAIPVGVVVLRDVARERAWGQLGAGIAVGAAVLCVLPLWSLGTLGTVRETPRGLYTRQYMPYDGIGFGLDTSLRAERRLPGRGELQQLYVAYRREHTVSALPRIAWTRAKLIARDMWYEWRMGLAAFAVVGLLVFTPAAWFGLASLATHVALYLLYGTVSSAWTVYYMESTPVLAFASALGIAATIERASRGKRAAATIATFALALLAFVPTVRTWRLMRNQGVGEREYFERFRAVTAGIADARAIVFVRYAPTHNENLELVRLPPGLEDARLWVVRDRGAENGRLMAAAPERRAYLFDESTWSLTRLP